MIWRCCNRLSPVDLEPACFCRPVMWQVVVNKRKLKLIVFFALFSLHFRREKLESALVRWHRFFRELPASLKRSAFAEKKVKTAKIVLDRFGCKVYKQRFVLTTEHLFFGNWIVGKIDLWVLLLLCQFSWEWRETSCRVITGEFDLG